MAKVLITGASSGIGRELAKEFAANGHELIICARNQQALESLAKEIGGAMIIIKDLSDINQVKELAQEEADILVNNAGFGDYGEITELDPEKQIKMIDLNISALEYLSQSFAQKMKEKGAGKILNVASIAGFMPAGPYMATYYATKAFVLSYTRAIAKELEETGVQVSALCPGPTHSNFGQEAGVSNSTAFKMSMTSEEVAKQAYKKFMRGDKVIITGFKNKFLVFLMRFLPNSWIINLNSWLLKKS